MTGPARARPTRPAPPSAAPARRRRLPLLVLLLALVTLLPALGAGPARAQTPPAQTTVPGADQPEPSGDEGTAAQADEAQEPPETTTTAAPTTPIVRPETGATAAAAATTGTPPHQLELRGQTPFVAPTDTFAVQVAVHDAPAGARLGFELYVPITTPTAAVEKRRDALDQWVQGHGPNQGVFSNKFAAGLPLDLFTPGPDGTLTATFPLVPAGHPVPPTGFQIDDAGVYPLAVRLLDEEAKVLDTFTTFLIRLPSDKSQAAPLQVATIVNLHAPVATQPDGTTVIRSDVRAVLDTTIHQLDRHRTVPLTLDPTPETVEALAQISPAPSGSSATTSTTAPTSAPPTAPPTSSTAPTSTPSGTAPPAAASLGSAPAPPVAPVVAVTDPVGTLASAMTGREVLSSTFVDVDLDAWVASELRSRLEGQLRLGAQSLDTFLHPAPSADRHTWRAITAPSSDALAELRDLGIEQLIVPDSQVAPLDPKVFNDVQAAIARTQPFDVDDGEGGRLRTGATDTRLAARLTSSTMPALAAQITLTDLALIYFSASESVTNLPTTPRGVILDAPEDVAALQALDVVLAALVTPPAPTGGGRAVFAPITLDGYFKVPPAAAPRTNTPLVRPLVPAPEPEDLGEFPQHVTAAEANIAAFASMAATSAPQRVASLQRLVDVSGAAGLDAAGREAYLASVDATVDATASAITAPEQEQITFTDSEGQLPLQLENGLDYPVDVLVELRNEQLTFPGADGGDHSSFVTTLQPGDNRVPVKVRSATSCVCSIELTVRSPDRQLLLTQGVYRVRATVVSGLGLVLTIAAGFILLLWWGRSWRKTRRERRQPPSDDAPTDGATTDPVPVG